MKKASNVYTHLGAKLIMSDEFLEDVKEMHGVDVLKIASKAIDTMLRIDGRFVFENEQRVAVKVQLNAPTPDEYSFTVRFVKVKEQS